MSPFSLSTLDHLDSRSVFPVMPPSQTLSTLNDAELEAAIGLIPAATCAVPPPESFPPPSELIPFPSVWPSQFPTLSNPTLATSHPPVFPAPAPQPQFPNPSTSSHHIAYSSAQLIHIPSPEKPYPAPLAPTCSSSQDDAHSVSRPAPSPDNPESDDNTSSSTISVHDSPPLRHSTYHLNPPCPASNSITPRPTGLSAVDHAKHAAEEFTLAELAKRRRDPNGVPLARANHDNVDNGGPKNDRPGKVSYHRYQKRLQKNRDSAFVSRIRRREYTRVLENTLLSVEKEKDAAVARFTDMKRCFELASAELNGMKQAAQSRFVQFGESVVAPGGGTNGNVEQGAVGARGPATMFLVGLLFGALLPDWGKGVSRLTQRNGFAFLRGASVWTGTSADRNSRVPGGGQKNGRGKVWGSSSRRLNGKEGVVLPTVQLVIAQMRRDVERAFGKEDGALLMDEVKDWVCELSENDVEELWGWLRKSRAEAGNADDCALAVAKRLRRRKGQGEDQPVQSILSKLENTSSVNE